MAHISTNDAWAFQLPTAPTLPCPCPSAVADLAPPTKLDGERTLADRFVIALVGLAFEARIASGPGVVVICRNSERDGHFLDRPRPQTRVPQHHQFWRSGRTGAAFTPGKLGRRLVDHRRAAEPSDRPGLV